MDTMKAVRVDVCGAAEQMLVKDVPLPKPGTGEVRIRLKACGINLIDTYHRSGLYPLALPTGLGCEGAGLVDALGEGIDDLIEGDRVGFAMAMGAYAEAIVLPRGALVKIPAGVTDEEAAAVLLKAMTVDYLFNDTFPLSGGETVLFHAAAGGVGLIACQWARSEGINLIATAGSDEKCQLAVQHGAKYCINYKSQDFVKEVKEITNGAGVEAVMDSVGASTFQGSLDCLKPLGMMISFGNASGKVPPFDIGILAAKGSLKVTRPTVFSHISNRDTCQLMADQLFKKVSDGTINLLVGQEFPLSDISKAHDILEGRETTGSTILTP